MGLDALGDEYWIRESGTRLENAAASGDAAWVKKELEENFTYSMRNIFSQSADRTLLRSVYMSDRKGYADIAILLLNGTGFADSLSYQGLLMANERAKEKNSEELSALLSAMLEHKTQAIKELEGAKEGMAALSYLEHLKTRTVSNADGDEVMLTGPDDALMYAIENGEMLSLIKLANSDMHRELDAEKLSFMRSRAERLPAHPAQLKEVAIFVLDVMERDGKRDEIVERTLERSGELAGLASTLVQLSRPSGTAKEKNRSM
jgi:hypothetical protein